MRRPRNTASIRPEGRAQADGLPGAACTAILLRNDTDAKAGAGAATPAKTARTCGGC